MTPWTHSDNLKENEVLSGLTKSFFKNRRQRVISKMLERNSEDTKLKPLAEMEGKYGTLSLSKLPILTVESCGISSTPGEFRRSLLEYIKHAHKNANCNLIWSPIID